MPFGLKNAGATYTYDVELPRATDQAVQVYIDDVVITTTSESTLIVDLRETFDNLDKYQPLTTLTNII
jgi:hypothetical protein